MQWKTTDKFYKATFTLNDLPLEAFYAMDGTFLAKSGNLTVEQLPLSLMLVTNEKSSTGKITYLTEIASKRVTEYYMTLQTAKQTFNYKSTGDGGSRY